MVNGADFEIGCSSHMVIRPRERSKNPQDLTMPAGQEGAQIVQESYDISSGTGWMDDALSVAKERSAGKDGFCF